MKSQLKFSFLLFCGGCHVDVYIYFGYRYHLNCSICKIRGHGCCVQCTYGRCYASGHPMCIHNDALSSANNRWYIEKTDDVEGEISDVYEILCPKHAHTASARKKSRNDEKSKESEEIYQISTKKYSKRTTPLNAEDFCLLYELASKFDMARFKRFFLRTTDLKVLFNMDENSKTLLGSRNHVKNFSVINHIIRVAWLIGLQPNLHVLSV